VSSQTSPDRLDPAPRSGKPLRPDLRFNRPLDEKAQKYLNHFVDDEEIGLLRRRGDDKHLVLTFLVKHADREGALQNVSSHWQER
jgi:hypothetical protein